MNTFDIYGRRSYPEILSLTDWEVIDTEYNAVGIDKVKIDGNTFTNYGQYSFIWEKTYVKSPERAMDGSMGAINALSTFLTPHLIMDFSLISIDDYRALMKLHYTRNEFTVECYDPIYNHTIKVKMYFATEQMAKLHTIARKRLNNNEWEDWIELVGAYEYQVEMIGTNNDLDLVSVTYNYNAPTDNNGSPIYPNGSPIPNEFEEDVYRGEEIVIGANSTFKDNPPSPNYKFDGWRDAEGTVWTEGKIVTIYDNIELFAQWKPTSFYTLSYNYGMSKPYEVDGEPIYNKQVEYGLSIGTTPNVDSAIYTKIGDAEYITHRNPKWYKYPSRDPDMLIVHNTPYWLKRDTIIYCLYETAVYTVTFDFSDGQIPNETRQVPYGEKVYLPEYTKGNKKIEGWYTERPWKNKFNGNMPPYNLTLYARWTDV
jgi:uncharacterized repeat protein (TIGR02543 family)